LVGFRQDAQRKERGQPLPVRRTFEHAKAVIVDADRFLPLRPVRGQIACGEQPAAALRICDEVLGDLAFIKSVAAAFGQQAKRTREIGLHQNVAGSRRASIDQQRTRGFDVGA